MTLTLGMHRNKASSETISHTKGRGGIGKLHKQGLSSTQLQRKKVGNMTSDLTGHPGNRTEMEASQEGGEVLQVTKGQQQTSNDLQPSSSSSSM